MHPHRILSLLFLLLLSLALGACASHDARPAPEPGAPLPVVTLERGDRVFIKIENGKSMTEDLHSMLTAYLQSERGLNPASDVKEADLVILVEIRDVWATSDGSRVSAGGRGRHPARRGRQLHQLGHGSRRGHGRPPHPRQGQPAHRCRDQPRQSPQQGRGLRRAGRRPVPGHPGVHQGVVMPGPSFARDLHVSIRISPEGEDSKHKGIFDATWHPVVITRFFLTAAPRHPASWNFPPTGIPFPPMSITNCMDRSRHASRPLKKLKNSAAAKGRPSLSAPSTSTAAVPIRPRPSSSTASNRSFPALLDMPVISAV